MEFKLSLNNDTSPNRNVLKHKVLTEMVTIFRLTNESFVIIEITTSLCHVTWWSMIHVVWPSALKKKKNNSEITLLRHWRHFVLNNTNFYKIFEFYHLERTQKTREYNHLQALIKWQLPSTNLQWCSNTQLVHSVRPGMCPWSEVGLHS